MTTSTTAYILLLAALGVSILGLGVLGSVLAYVIGNKNDAVRKIRFPVIVIAACGLASVTIRSVIFIMGAMQ